MGDLVQMVTTDLTFHEGRLVPVGTPITLDTSKIELKEATKDHPGNMPNLAPMGSAIINVATPVAPIAPTGPYPTMPQQVPPGAFQTPAGYVVPGGALLVGEGSQAAIDAANGPSIADQRDAMEEEAPVRRQAAEATGDANTAAISNGPAAAFPTVLGGDDAAELSRYRSLFASGASPTAVAAGGLSDDERRELEELRQFRTQAIASGSGTAPATGPAPVENGENSNATGNGAAAQDGATDFDANAVVDGTVPVVASRLSGLSREQLVAVRAAEQDREEPRSGVTHAIDAAIAKLDEQGGDA